MAKPSNYPVTALDKSDYLEASNFTFDFQRGGAVTLIGIKEGVSLVAGTFDVGKHAEAAKWIEQYNRDRYNMYFHVNRLRDRARDKKAKKAKKADVVSVHALHVDVDDPSENAKLKLLSFSPKPSIILFSGGGWQAFWLLDEPLLDLDRAEILNAEIARRLGGDACQNVDRIMRVPDTINWPNSRKRRDGRVPVRAYLVAENCDFSEVHNIEAFAGLRDSAVHSGLIAETGATNFPIVSIADLGIDDDELISLIQSGDDQKRPRGGPDPRFPSRSEAYYSVACSLARRGKHAEIIAGVLINPDHGISEAILEKASSRAYALRQAQKAVAHVTNGWPDTFKNGNPRATFPNALTGLDRLGVTFEHDAFKNRKRIGGHLLNQFQGDITDDAGAMLRKVFLDEHGFDPGKNHLYDAMQVVCLDNSYHPIREYLAGLTWDGTGRLDTWLIDYMGAEDNELHRTIGKMVMAAAVRRVRAPGCKFDFMIVIEGIQGSGKSTAIAILAGDDNFSDQNLMALDDKAQMEALEGVWLYEVAELDGMSRAEVSKVKAFISRTEDRGRPAYARFKESWPRQCVLIGTTNDSFYLKDTTGNRRFLPVKSNVIDLDGLRRDRDQLWAEASQLEESGFPITLPEHSWQASAEAQQARMEADPWLDVLAKVEGLMRDGFERVATEMLYGEDYLNIRAAELKQYHSKRVATVMRELGWDGPKKMRVVSGTPPVRGYERPTNQPDTVEM